MKDFVEDLFKDLMKDDEWVNFFKQKDLVSTDQVYDQPFFSGALQCRYVYPYYTQKWTWDRH